MQQLVEIALPGSPNYEAEAPARAEAVAWFRRGVNDLVAGAIYPPEYEKLSRRSQLAYERGRATAASAVAYRAGRSAALASGPDRGALDGPSKPL